MIVTLNCLQDVIRARPDQGAFSFTQQDLENFFMQVFAPDQGYPAGAVTLEFLSNPEMVRVEREEEAMGQNADDPAAAQIEAHPEAEEGSLWEEQPLTNEELTEFALNPTNLASFGLKIIVENQQELDFDHELVRQIFAGIIAVARHRVDENRPMSPGDHSSMQEAAGPSEDLEGSQAEISRAGSIERSKSELDRSMIQALNDLKDKFKIVYRTEEQLEQQI